MAVHDAIRRAVDGRRIAREDQRAAIDRMAAEIARRAEQDREPVPADETHTMTTPEASSGYDQG